MQFKEMKLDEKVIKALHDADMVKATEVQEKTIPLMMNSKDVIVQSMTGSGKTAAFAIPILHKVSPRKGVQSLIIAPTRELALQITDHIEIISKYSDISACTIYGGVSINPQINALRHSEIVVGTPGRILDHINRRTFNLSKIKILVLDEADRMLDMGFIDDIKRILSRLPRQRQTTLFSATIPDNIKYIAKRFMKNPEMVKVKSQVSTDKLSQFYYDVQDNEKVSLLVHLIEKERPKLAIVFCATRHRVDMVANSLQKNKIEAKAIHGGKSQSSRTNIMEGFHKGHPHILVATDVAARGLDISNVTHIFNYDLPREFDAYTHRIGRTARIGKEGKAISLLAQKDHQIFSKLINQHDIKKMKEKFEKLRYEISPAQKRKPKHGKRKSKGIRRKGPRRY